MTLLYVDTKAAQVEKLTDYIFKNKLLAAEAVQMAAPKIAAISKNSFIGLVNNKRLAVLGDVVLAKVLCSLWYDRHDSRGSELTLADWTTLRNDMVSNENLARVGYALGIDTCVFCNEGTVVSAKMVTNTVEAIVGAIYQDGGDDAATRVIIHLGLTQHGLIMVMFNTLHPTT
ncbi:hypothetical protein N0V94_004300 [Neodidymelliopsis sp. IMI 364377]|nr:hypothetical protein N0V94_004300 [Neodidymelliopsis sp. IMI 364377]